MPPRLIFYYNAIQLFQNYDILKDAVDYESDLAMRFHSPFDLRRPRRSLNDDHGLPQGAVCVVVALDEGEDFGAGVVFVDEGEPDPLGHSRASNPWRHDQAHRQRRMAKHPLVPRRRGRATIDSEASGSRRNRIRTEAFHRSLSFSREA